MLRQQQQSQQQHYQARSLQKQVFGDFSPQDLQTMQLTHQQIGSVHTHQAALSPIRGHKTHHCNVVTVCYSSVMTQLSLDAAHSQGHCPHDESQQERYSGTSRLIEQRCHGIMVKHFCGVELCLPVTGLLSMMHKSRVFPSNNVSICSLEERAKC